MHSSNLHGALFFGREDDAENSIMFSYYKQQIVGKVQLFFVLI